MNVYDDINEFYTFSEIVVGIVDKFDPIKKFRIKKDSHVPWLIKELLYLITKRAIAYGLIRNVVDKQICE